MAKQFIKGNIYVFSNKKFATLEGKKESKWHTWVKLINGSKVNIEDINIGKCKTYEVFPEWCKCIKNNN